MPGSGDYERSGCGLEGRQTLAITKSLRHVEPIDRLAACKIGQGAGDAQNAMKATGGQIHCIGSLAQQFKPRLVRACKAFEQLAINLGIVANFGKAELTVSGDLPRAGRADTPGDIGACFLR